MVLGIVAAAAMAAPQAASADDRATVAALDIAYQEAVKRSDTDTMDRILHKDFHQVWGDGQIMTRDELISRVKSIKYEVQDEDPGTQLVHVFGDTAIVTARIWVKGVRADGASFDRRVWFSDTYIRTPEGWRYVFAQVALPPAK
jgi:ketosteroid isomerase-like protein